MKYSLHFLLILCAVEGYRGQRPYQCGARPCSPEFNPVCGWKLSEEGETIDKMFPNVCVMGEENDCNENGKSQYNHVRYQNLIFIFFFFLLMIFTTVLQIKIHSVNVN
ncbi:unnamed protein product [Nezara viridula]|uniref:Neuropeptide n=1 Tax=Nezara viridula TaxID=85310 RepID=A0A9P0HV85_NEZVI|nr:unnamed protein product [Nezara viridula]